MSEATITVLPCWGSPSEIAKVARLEPQILERFQQAGKPVAFCASKDENGERFLNFYTQMFSPPLGYPDSPQGAILASLFLSASDHDAVAQIVLHDA